MQLAKLGGARQRAEVDDRHVGLLRAEHAREPRVLDAVGDQLEARVLIDQRVESAGDDVLELGDRDSNGCAGHDHRGEAPPITVRVSACVAKG